MIPANLHNHFDIIQSEGIDVDGLFEVKEIPFQEKFIRRFASPVVNKMPSSIRWLSTDMAKRLRNPGRMLKLHYPLDFEENKKIVERIKMLNARPWWGKRAVVCLCHDVDTREGAAFVKEMAAINQHFGVAATFQFLTGDDYPLDPALLKALAEGGFEIGLHGLTHDQGFAFRDEATMLEQLSRALNALEGFDVVGYRSPALSLSDQLLRQLKRLHLLYDSSFQIASPFYNSVKLPFPVYLKPYGIWELPLMVQDDNYLRDTRTQEDVMLDSMHRFIRETVLLNGACVILMHPHNMMGRKEFYKRLLKMLKEFDEVSFRTMKEVVRYVDGGLAMEPQEILARSG